MKVEREKLIRQLRKLPEVQRKHIAKAIKTSTDEAARVARTLAPNVTGETRDRIHTDIREGGLVGEVIAIRSDAPRPEKDKAYSIEHGRKAGSHGTTDGFHYMQTTRQYLGKKHAARIKRAINKAAKEVSGNG